MTFAISNKDDDERIQQWLNADPSKVTGLTPDWWWTDAAGSLLVCRVDSETEPVLYARFDLENSSTARMHTLFSPTASKKLIATTLAEGFPHVARKIRISGFGKIIFESKSISLINFMVNTFGFERADNDDYLLVLHPPQNPEELQN